jgi:hypothetical protein
MPSSVIRRTVSGGLFSLSNDAIGPGGAIGKTLKSTKIKVKKQNNPFF